MNIPDKAVEAAAKELYAEGRSTTDGFDMWPEWEDAPEIGRGAFRDEARAALKAAAPFIAADIREELCLVRAERDWMKEQLGRLHLDTLGEYADSLEDPQ